MTWLKNEGGILVREILKAGCEIKILWCDRDFLHFNGGTRDGFQTDDGTQDQKTKTQARRGMPDAGLERRSQQT